ncbi:hypothetical protein TMS3_0104590 [Pseudomonas taeanensis MS-3]|jgi:hypothetical protein|uniref:Uncharacterized protein n=1 Tax=Pseudomonas taeanensis MS-3 TaxID=1395571 RepID=A0A0A1YQ00_9PSED|nr:hypothetical protein [Pseudomonas taeanensis]KFX71216.1 hypothetical protein TMS3_0104590 [Pseudomonas taeanensis MS-3]
MSELKNQPIDQGTRKRTEYDNARRARLALNIERTDGGMLQIPVESDMRSHEEEQEIQQNTFLAVVPMARLPGHDQFNEAPKGALPRPGRIYVFQNGKLWRELACDGQGSLSDVDVAHWRKLVNQGEPADDRTPVGKPLALTLVPMLLKGRFVGDQYAMAYSEMAWTWEYIAWLEANSSRVRNRCQNLAPAWSAAVVGGEQWKPTQAMPIIVIDKQVEGLRARDFNVESTLADPAVFTPSFAAFTETEWVVKLQRTQEQLAAAQQGEQPYPLPTLEASQDVLAEKKLRGYPQLVGFMLDDPLFALRHATTQARLAEAYLLSLNALIAHRPNGRYAQVVYSTVMRPGKNPLAKFSDLIDKPNLLKTVFEDERKAVRNDLEHVLKQLVGLFEKRLDVVAADWFFSHDERLLEPYAWLTEALDSLNKNPAQCDALCHASTSPELEASIDRLTQALLQAKHPLARRMLVGGGGELPEAAKRLQALLAKKREPDPARMGLSTLLQTAAIDTAGTDTLALYKNMTALVGDFMDLFATAVGTQLNRLSASLVNIELSRLFAPAFGVLEKLSPSWKGLKLMPKGDATAQGWVILGVEGAGLRHGLTVEERRTLTRKNYRYATLHDKAGTPIGSTSPRLAERQLPNLGRIAVIAAPADHPQVHNLSAWKLQANRTIQATMETPVVPLVAVVCAMFNLQAQMVAFRGLKEEAGDGFARGVIGVGVAGLDQAVALGALTKPMLGAENGLVTALNKPRFDVAKISTRWAASLYEQTGSTKLPVLRLVSGFAMVFTTGLAAWDAKRAWHQGDHDAALAYGVAAAGGAAWTAYAFGMAINPFVLVAGGVLFIGGGILANWLVDSDAEALLKNGPFGRDQGQVGLLDGLLGDDQRFAHLQDPQVAYTQLIGILGKPVIQVSRLADWRAQAAPAQRALMQAIEAERQSSAPDSRWSCANPALQAFENEDWVLTVHSPLLAMFRGEHDFQLFAEEQLGVLPRTGVFNVERVERRGIDTPKLSALALDEGTVLYVLPRQFPQLQLSPLQRHHNSVTQRLKVSAQFHLGQAGSSTDSLVLPQPTPKRWQAYSPAFGNRPAQNAQPDDVPYWQIEISEFKA